ARFLDARESALPLAVLRPGSAIQYGEALVERRPWGLRFAALRVCPRLSFEERRRSKKPSPSRVFLLFSEQTERETRTGVTRCQCVPCRHTSCNLTLHRAS